MAHFCTQESIDGKLLKELGIKGLAAVKVVVHPQKLTEDGGGHVLVAVGGLTGGGHVLLSQNTFQRQHLVTDNVVLELRQTTNFKIVRYGYLAAIKDNLIVQLTAHEVVVGTSPLLSQVAHLVVIMCSLTNQTRVIHVITEYLVLLMLQGVHTFLVTACHGIVKSVVLKYHISSFVLCPAVSPSGNILFSAKLPINMADCCLNYIIYSSHTHVYYYLCTVPDGFPVGIKAEEYGKESQNHGVLRTYKGR